VFGPRRVRLPRCRAFPPRVIRSSSAAIPQPSGEHYWWQIILPGSVVGLIVGYATQQRGGAQTS
jgi:hypothetical protein